MVDFLKNINLKGDKVIWGVIISLSLFSVLLVYSTAGWEYLFSHLIKLSVGLFFLYQVHKIKFKYFAKIGVLGFVISIILLLLVFVIGVTVNGASRWLSIAGVQFQPSDIAKLSILLFMARQLSKYRHEIKDFKFLFLYILAPLIVICSLILPNNFSTSALIFLNGLVLMFVAKVNIKYIASIIGFGIFGAFFIYGIAKISPELSNKIMPRSATWVSRVDSYFNTKEVKKLDQDYQQHQALVAIYNGGFSGVGPGKSTQRNILPYSSSDFIFAIMVEEYGLLIGAIFPMLLYLILFYRALRIATKIASVFGGLICVGLMFSLVFQAFINMLVSVGVLPVTGQTLPLISMGGTSILFTCITLGIILSVSNDTSDREYETA
ncbi:FtsW/RodA/SpoVE family cell cycle protein [Flavobacteriales bacterium]|nr:FtsW/RodA/SpoVE family cell cycle protein [Flavobacteriales bacterium]